jgi:hypothetical protein
MPLRSDKCLAGLTLGVERVELLFESFLARFTGIDSAAQPELSFLLSRSRARFLDCEPGRNTSLPVSISTPTLFPSSCDSSVISFLVITKDLGNSELMIAEFGIYPKNFLYFSLFAGNPHGETGSPRLRRAESRDCRRLRKHGQGIFTRRLLDEAKLISARSFKRLILSVPQHQTGKTEHAS